MRLIHNLSTNPFFNMAADEYLLTNSREEIFMLWQNAPCVVIGKNQNALAEIDVEFLEQELIKLVRRSTGGGAVYHDLGNLNDLLLNGSKISGCAQLVYQGRLLHHGTLLINSDLSIMSKVLKPTKEKYAGNAVKSVESRVCNVNDYLSAAVMIDEIITKLFQAADRDKKSVPGGFTERELKEIKALEQEK